jgi:hypothetical protein
MQAGAALGRTPLPAFPTCQMPALSDLHATPQCKNIHTSGRSIEASPASPEKSGQLSQLDDYASEKIRPNFGHGKKTLFADLT